MVSVIIPTSTGGLTHLARLMPNLALEELEIIIVDNASKDGTVNYLSQYDCIIKVNKVNKNFAGGNNQGARLASNDYLLFLNNDTVVTSGFAKEMISTFEIDPKIAVVGCAIYTMDLPKRIQHAGVCFTTEYLPYELGLPIPSVAPGINKNDPRVLAIREVPSVTAACMMVKKSVFNEVGGFDEGYINGWEDNDLVLKIREKGYKVWYNGQAQIYHKHFGSINRLKWESQNRSRFDQIWITTGRAKDVLKDFREG